MYRVVHTDGGIYDFGYTATQDCWYFLSGYVTADGSVNELLLNGVSILWGWGGYGKEGPFQIILPLKKGDSITRSNNNQFRPRIIAVYGIK